MQSKITTRAVVGCAAAERGGLYAEARPDRVDQLNVQEGTTMAATTKDVLMHHLDCFGKADLAGIMADYTAASCIFTPEGILRGPAAIKPLFVKLFEEFSKPGMSFDMLRQDVEGDVAYIVWKAETADNRYELGTDTFVVRDAKIVAQTFAGKITPKR